MKTNETNKIWDALNKLLDESIAQNKKVWNKIKEIDSRLDEIEESL